MRVVFVTLDAPFGMKESYVINELNCLSRFEFEYSIFPARGKGRIINKAYLKKILRERGRLRVYFFAIKKFIRIFSTLHFILSRQKPKRKLYTIYSIGKIVLLSYFLESEKINHIHAYWASTPATIAFAASMICNCPWSFSAHRADIENNDLLFEKIDRACFVRTISNQGLKKLSKIHPNKRTKIFTIHMGVNIGKYKTRRYRKQKIRMICVGDLIKSKNISMLIDRVAKSEIDFSLDIYGDGPLKKILQQQIEKNNLNDKVQILNRIENTKLIEKYKNQCYDILIHPSKIEGIPVAIMEAMANGIIVATTLSGGTGELANSRNSYILKSDLSNLDKILHLYIESENSSRRFIAAQSIKKDFNIEKTSKQMFEKINLCQKEK